MIKFLFASISLLSFDTLLAKETENKICFKRGVEVILPYEHGISLIKKAGKELPVNNLKDELRNFKNKFELNFYGLNLYESAGCSKSRLTEYLDCLIETDGKDCKIYYSQMRLVD